MATVDFTLEDLKQVFATKDDVREIVREELIGFEPKVRKIVKFENMESEGRIKAEIKHFVEVDNIELKQRFKNAAAIFNSEG